MLICDLNCDMGEGMGNDEAIMPFITSANISCGFHAGNGDTIRDTMALAVKYKLRIGAHPSFRDKENFGRKEMYLTKDKLYAIVLEQLIKLDLIAKAAPSANFCFPFIIPITFPLLSSKGPPLLPGLTGIETW